MIRSLCLALASLCLAPAQSAACGLALLLAVDVSGSVDPLEYKVQRDGLALALRDGIVSEALVREQAFVSVMQWTGTSRQRITIPWTQLRSFDDVDALADRVADDPRVWRNFSTAIGEALDKGHAAFVDGPRCDRRVMDVSGDGVSNEGIAPRLVHPRLRAAGIVVNGLVIETHDANLTDHYWENVIIGEGAFVVTANGFREYPERIRLKLIRETARATAALAIRN